jgi:hypothetical protein
LNYRFWCCPISAFSCHINSPFSFFSILPLHNFLFNPKYEIPFFCLIQENKDQTDEISFDPEDPTWQKEYDAIENREEIEKLQGQWLLNAMMKTAEPPKNMVTTKSIYIEEQIQLEFE